jgi:hypothetical protein
MPTSPISPTIGTVLAIPRETRVKLELESLKVGFSLG